MVILIGGWTNPFEKYARQSWDHFPKNCGMKIKKYLFNQHLLVVILWVILLFHIVKTPAKTNHYSLASKRKKKSLGNSQRERSIGTHLFNLARDLRGPAVWIPKTYGLPNGWWIPWWWNLPWQKLFKVKTQQKIQDESDFFLEEMEDCVVACLWPLWQHMTVHAKEFPPKNCTQLGPNMLGQQHTHSLAGSQIRPDVLRFDLVNRWPILCVKDLALRIQTPPSEKNRNVGVIPFLRLYNGFLGLINRFLTTQPPLIKLADSLCVPLLAGKFHNPGKGGVRKSSPNTWNQQKFAQWFFEYIRFLPFVAAMIITSYIDFPTKCLQIPTKVRHSNLDKPSVSHTHRIHVYKYLPTCTVKINEM